MFIFRAVALAFLIATALTCLGGAISSAFAQEDYWSLSCGELWLRRNTIFARNGYCFKTDRALRVFGNANCRFEVEAGVPMSRAEREEVEIIRAVEKRKGC
jgi:hypothetical protein